MKWMILILMLGLVHAAPAQSQDYYQTGMNSVLVADWAQTRWISENYDKGYFETNRVMGKYPTTGEVNILCRG